MKEEEENESIPIFIKNKSDFAHRKSMVNESYNKGPKLQKIDHEEAKKKISQIIHRMNNGPKILAGSPKGKKFIEGAATQLEEESVNLPNSVK